MLGHRMQLGSCFGRQLSDVQPHSSLLISHRSHVLTIFEVGFVAMFFANQVNVLEGCTVVVISEPGFACLWSTQPHAIVHKEVTIRSRKSPVLLKIAPDSA